MIGEASRGVKIGEAPTPLKAWILTELTTYPPLLAQPGAAAWRTSLSDLRKVEALKSELTAAQIYWQVFLRLPDLRGKLLEEARKALTALVVQSDKPLAAQHADKLLQRLD